jgi:hypothetical protein
MITKTFFDYDLTFKKAQELIKDVQMLMKQI